MVIPSVATSVTSQMPPLVLSSKRLSESLIVGQAALWMNCLVCHARSPHQ
ncbi:MAG TPA: hypothetical protein VF844_12650 [Ktedonobacteraceae bacterium]